jgi:hypothetical protein
VLSMTSNIVPVQMPFVCFPANPFMAFTSFQL